MSEMRKPDSENMDDLFVTEETPSMSLSMDGRDIEVHEIKDFVVEHQGVNTEGRIFYPEGDGPFPVFFYIHGGAFIGGFNFMDEPVCRQCVRDAGCAVISPNYQLAPDHKYPSALNELYDLLLYFKAHAAEYNLDMDRLAVGGSSAGGNYAAALCVKAYQTKELNISYQALVYPSIDLYNSGESKVTDLTDTKAMPPQGVKDMINLYVPEGEDLSDPLLSPALGPVEAFPKTSVFSGRYDIFWKEDRAFVNKLTDAGVEVLYKSYGNIGHGFMELAGYEHVSRDVRNLIASELKRNL